MLTTALSNTPAPTYGHDHPNIMHKYTKRRHIIYTLWHSHLHTHTNFKMSSSTLGIIPDCHLVLCAALHGRCLHGPLCRYHTMLPLIHTRTHALKHRQPSPHLSFPPSSPLSFWETADINNIYCNLQLVYTGGCFGLYIGTHQLVQRAAETRLLK